jgi:hypothetical protein
VELLWILPYRSYTYRHVVPGLAIEGFLITQQTHMVLGLGLVIRFDILRTPGFIGFNGQSLSTQPSEAMLPSISTYPPLPG